MPGNSGPPERAILFVDGNNWYHALKREGVPDLMGLDYAKISQKLCMSRQWVSLRYYIGQVPNQGNQQLYADQRRLVSKLENTDPRIGVHFGRLEPRTTKNDLAEDLLGYLHQQGTAIPVGVAKNLSQMAQAHRKTSYMVEKAVDVMLAVDLVVLAQHNKFDVAYVLSQDGDYTHAVTCVRGMNKKVFVAHPKKGYEICNVADAYIKIDKAWLAGCR